MGFFFFSLVKLFGNNFDLIKSLAIRSRSKAKVRPYHSSSSFNSYASFIMNEFNKKYSLLCINSVNREWHTHPAYHTCVKEEVVNRKGKLHRSRELLLFSKRLLITYPPAVFIGSIRG